MNTENYSEAKRILCMYSGGVDSLGSLFTLLTDSRYAEFRIHVHHLHLLNREERAQAELLATKNTIQELQTMGMPSFLYTESSHDYRFMRREFVWDMDICAFMAANICIADPTINHVAMGRTKTDVSGCSNRFQARMNRAQQIFDAVWSLESRERPSYVFPVVDKTKTEIWKMLPKSLREHAWSCRTPVYEGSRAVVCGRCAACKDMLMVFGELADASSGG